MKSLEDDWVPLLRREEWGEGVGDVSAQLAAENITHVYETSESSESSISTGSLRTWDAYVDGIRVPSHRYPGWLWSKEWRVIG